MARNSGKGRGARPRNRAAPPAARKPQVAQGSAAAAAEADFAANPQDMAWARALVLAAVRACKWEDEKQGLALALGFDRVERAFLAHCYTPEVLREDSLFLLPPMHRFGWYCNRAFEALETSDPAGYARSLRAGLETCPQMKPMVEFLTAHTPQLKPPVPGELLALAEQVRTMLSAYAPDDPAVVMIKQSVAYQKVAHLIEGPDPGVFGGLPQ